MLKNCFAAFLRGLLYIRYRFEFLGFEKIPEGSSGFLVVPNHPALIDPVIVCSFLWRRFHLRPLVLEKYYNMPLLQPIMRWMRAIPIPDMEVDGGFYKRRRVAAAIEEVAQALKNGDNIIMYPSGRLMRSGHEKLGGTSGLFTILQKTSDIKLLMVRTRGLYGSSFSKAVTGGPSPNLVVAIRSNLARMFRGLVLFLPRRNVQLEVAQASADVVAAKTALALNRALEAWYNEGVEAEPVFVPYSFWGKTQMIAPKMREEDLSLEEVSADSAKKVIAQISKLSSVPESQIKPSMRLGDDLGMDSLMIAELLVWLEEEFAVTGIELPELQSVSSVIKLSSKVALSGQVDSYTEAPALWLSDRESREMPHLAEGSTLAECFVRRAKRLVALNQVAIADERSGIFTWRKLYISVLTLSSIFSKIEGQRVGIMLPASVASCLTYMALHLARKTPVLLNWTSGKKNLAHAVEISGVSSIVTSAAFLDRVQTDLGPIESRFLYLEDLKKKVTLAVKLRALYRSFLSDSAIIKLLKLDTVAETDVAAILFTSGSEAAPKGVPLSHKNIICNLKAALEVAKFRAEEVYLGFLPPFHSFGLALCMGLPLLAGLKTVLFADPNESRKLAHASRKWSISMLAGTPAFLKGILSAGDSDDFSKLAVLICGADKMPADLPGLVASRNEKAQLLEGYGITECSPIVTGNHPGEAAAGVGWPLPDVELLIVHHETHQPLPAGERGLVLISGPNVFGGYLSGKPDPFLNINGKKWYNSGDLGYLKNGALYLAGRLKRFTKIGGEMISLPAIEETLMGKWSPLEGLPEIAVVAKEHSEKERPDIVLFTTRREITLDAANDHLRDSGLSTLTRLVRVEYLNEMPLLGSGKVDIQKLMQMLSGAEA